MFQNPVDDRKYLIEVAVEERIGEGGGHPYEVTARVDQPVGPVRPEQWSIIISRLQTRQVFSKSTELWTLFTLPLFPVHFWSKKKLHQKYLTGIPQLFWTRLLPRRIKYPLPYCKSYLRCEWVKWELN